MYALEISLEIILNIDHIYTTFSKSLTTVNCCMTTKKIMQICRLKPQKKTSQFNMNYLPSYLVFISLLHSSILMTSAHSKCPETFNCRNLSMGFPFTNSNNPTCGLFTVDGCDSTNPTIFSQYSILKTISKNELLLLDPNLQNQLSNSRCQFLKNISLPQSPSVSFSFSPNLTFYTCSNQNGHEYFKNYSPISCSNYTVYYNTSETAAGESSIPQNCSVMQLPRNASRDSGDLFYLSSSEFFLVWNVSQDCYRCHLGGGQCFANTENEFLCRKGNKKSKKNFLVGGITTAVLTSISIVLILYIRRNRLLLKWFLFMKAKSEDEEKIEIFLKNNENFAPTRYKYSTIEKMTNSFSENLGQGGYGSVYKGKSFDGRLVAVKILNESKGNGEEFMNEVASISRTSHINIVTLFGFCFEGSKRALIYEFMPNGSLEKFISSSEVSLEWKKVLEIALGIARGLEYLHQGCNTRILHLDIKPHNILLDKDLNPRISDFGLAKLCPNRSSKVSISMARGSKGYMAPEVFCKSFGEVSNKSDVYSYGVMVLEIGGGLESFDPENADRTSEFYFSQHVYKNLEMEVGKGDDLFGEVINGDVSQLMRLKLMVVGLWCVQMDPVDRPSMAKVIEMLEGNFESLRFPPKPYLSSPPRLTHIFSDQESV